MVGDGRREQRKICSALTSSPPQILESHLSNGCSWSSITWPKSWNDYDFTVNAMLRGIPEDGAEEEEQEELDDDRDCVAVGMALVALNRHQPQPPRRRE